MRLVLPLPDGWNSLTALSPDLNTDVVQRIAPSVEPRVTVQYGAMVDSPLDGERWIKGILSEALPQSCQLVEEKRAPNQTVTGYPMQIIYTTIIDASGKIVEARMTALYAMLSHNAAAVLAVCRSDDRSDESVDLVELRGRYEEPAKTLFRAASPDFETGLCTLSALYEGLPGLWERK